MDVQKILDGAIRFSNFISVRLVFFSAVSLLLFPLFGVQNLTTAEVTDAFPVLEKLIETYDKTIETLGIDSVAIYLIFFVFVTILHLTYSVAVKLGSWLPVDLVFESFDSVERVFRTTVAQKAMEMDVNDELAQNLSSDLFQAHESVEDEWRRLTQNTKDLFSAMKALTILVFVSLFIFPETSRFDVVNNNRGLLLLISFAACFFFAQNTIHYHRSAFGKLQYLLENLVEKNLLGRIPKETMISIQIEMQEMRDRFDWRFDWTWPIFGSARMAIEAFNKRKRGTKGR